MGDNGEKGPYYTAKGFLQYGILVPKTVPVDMATAMLIAMLSRELGNSYAFTYRKYGAACEQSILAEHVEGPARVD